jgi:hypothetical protein
MAETIVRTFSLLVETDRKLEQLTKDTFRRNKGDVIDLAVSDLWQKINGDAPVQDPQQVTEPVKN